jgi:3-carboxy-cis,cis-muconate cycloisomerase
MSELFAGVLERGLVREAVSDAAWLRAMLAAEAALARARGLEELAAAIAATELDPGELGREAAASGNPVVPLAAALRARLGDEVHAGATSQDILDTAAMLVARGALAPLVDDLGGAAEAAARLAREHRETPIAGRTLLQQAVPTTFGLKAAGWMAALDASALGLRGLRFAAQLGGPAGTLADEALVSRYAAELELEAPVLPWHTDRTRIAALAGALGTACGAVAKAAGDVVLLAQTEVGEVRERAPGSSSSMPHKRNPVAAMSARACARQAPGLVATLLAAMEQEHERAAGAWHAEWRPLRELLVATGSAASWLRTCLEGLQVDPERMRVNLGAAGTEGGGSDATASAAALVDRALAGRRA